MIDSHGKVAVVEYPQRQDQGQIAMKRARRKPGVGFPGAPDIHTDRGPSLTRKRPGPTRHLFCDILLGTE